MKTETHFVDLDNHIYRTKIDLYKNDETLIGFKVICWDRVVECSLKSDEPLFKVKKLEDDDKKEILKLGFKNVGKKWSEDEEKELIEHFYYYNGDIQLISKLMERTERSIQIRLEMLELIKNA